MNTSVAIADPLLRQSSGRLACLSDPHRTVGDRRPSSWCLSPSWERDRHRHTRRSQSPGLRALVSHKARRLRDTPSWIIRSPECWNSRSSHPPNPNGYFTHPSWVCQDSLVAQERAVFHAPCSIHMTRIWLFARNSRGLREKRDESEVSSS